MAYIDKEKFIDILHAKADMALGTPKQVFLSVAKMLELIPAADVAPRSKVAQEIFEQIHREIAEAIKSNVRAIDERQEKYNIYEDDFIHRCYGKIDALRGIDGFITELKEKFVTDTNVGNKTSSADRCIVCGDHVPEGRQVCPKCEKSQGGSKC